jgi:plasmid maintenance system antidote protein VapI
MSDSKISNKKVKLSKIEITKNELDILMKQKIDDIYFLYFVYMIWNDKPTIKPGHSCNPGDSRMVKYKAKSNGTAEIRAIDAVKSMRISEKCDVLIRRTLMEHPSYFKQIGAKNSEHFELLEPISVSLQFGIDLFHKSINQYTIFNNKIIVPYYNYNRYLVDQNKNLLDLLLCTASSLNTLKLHSDYKILEYLKYDKPEVVNNDFKIENNNLIIRCNQLEADNAQLNSLKKSTNELNDQNTILRNDLLDSQNCLHEAHGFNNKLHEQSDIDKKTISELKSKVSELLKPVISTDIKKVQILMDQNVELQLRCNKLQAQSDIDKKELINLQQKYDISENKFKADELKYIKVYDIIINNINKKLEFKQKDLDKSIEMISAQKHTIEQLTSDKNKINSEMVLVVSQIQSIFNK